MQNFITRPNVYKRGEFDKAIIIIGDLPLGIGRGAVIIHHAASQHHQVIGFDIRASKQIVIQTVDFLQIIIINHQICLLYTSDAADE